MRSCAYIWGETMGFEWVAVEIIAILAETLACIYFLNSRYSSKYSTYAPEIICGIVVVCIGLLTRFVGLPGYDFAFIFLMLIYVFITKHGGLLQKFIGIIFVSAITLVTSLVGAGIVAGIMNTTIEATLTYQDTTRFVTIIFIKAIQVSLLYILSKKHVSIRNLQKIPTIVIGLVISIIFGFTLVIRASVAVPELGTEQSNLLIWASIGLLFIIIAIFLMYELFVKEEAKNANLAMNLQRLELERGFFNEINVIYSNIRVWRHEYRNNLIVLRDLVCSGEKDKILDYIDKISGDPLRFETTLHTENLILDAIVSSKVGLAQKQDIEVSIQAVYPKDNCIDDTDLCTIVGNLLDNAIEACGEPNQASARRFVDFAFLTKGKNIVISVRNSYFHEIKQENGRYATRKERLFHGIGLSLLDSVVRKYSGHVIRNHENGIFETHIIIPLLPPDKAGTEAGNV